MLPLGPPWTLSLCLHDPRIGIQKQMRSQTTLTSWNSTQRTGKIEMCHITRNRIYQMACCFPLICLTFLAWGLLKVWGAELYVWGSAITAAVVTPAQLVQTVVIYGATGFVLVTRPSAGPFTHVAADNDASLHMKSHQLNRLTFQKYKCIWIPNKFLFCAE